MCDSWDTSSGAAGNNGTSTGGTGGGNNTSSSGPTATTCDLSRKWVCKACTYENWPRASKCAICCHPKNYNIFLDPHRPHDIYEVSPNSSTRVSHVLTFFFASSITHSQIASLFGSAHSQSASVYNPKNKWSCSSCTYLNWPKASKCTQCQRRRSASPPFGPTPGHHHHHHHHHHDHNVRSPKLKSKDPTGPRSENHTFPLIPSWSPSDLRSRSARPSDSDNTGTDYYYNDRNRGLEVSQSRRTSFSSTRSPPPATPAPSSGASSAPVLPSNVQKWSCSVCTYENWPRASKCNMCQTRRRTPSFTRTSTTTTAGDAISDSLSLMKLSAAATPAAADMSLDETRGSGAEASGGLISEHNLSGFSSDSDDADDGGDDDVLAFKTRKRRE